MSQNLKTRSNGDIISSGIYCIKFLGCDKEYIGSSFDLCKRGLQHLNALKSKKHCNKKLQNACNKYGLENFIFEILEIVDFKKEDTKDFIKCKLRELEQQYLDSIFCANSNEKYFKEKSLNLSKNTKGTSYHDKELHKNKKTLKRVYVFDLNMNFIEIVNGLREAERKYKISGIKSCCKLKTSRAGNWIFRYEETLNDKYISKRKSPKGFKNPHVLPINEYDLNGNFVREWRCMEDATKELCLSSGAISRVIRGIYSHTKGKVFKNKINQNGLRIN